MSRLYLRLAKEVWDDVIFVEGWVGRIACSYNLPARSPSTNPWIRRLPYQLWCRNRLRCRALPYEEAVCVVAQGGCWHACDGADGGQVCIEGAPGSIPRYRIGGHGRLDDPRAIAPHLWGERNRERWASLKITPPLSYCTTSSS